MLTIPDNIPLARTHRDTTLQAKVTATNYVLIPEPLGRCDAFLRLRFMVRRKLTNLLKFLGPVWTRRNRAGSQWWCVHNLKRASGRKESRRLSLEGDDG